MYMSHNFAVLFVCFLIFYLGLAMNVRQSSDADVSQHEMIDPVMTWSDFPLLKWVMMPIQPLELGMMTEQVLDCPHR